LTAESGVVAMQIPLKIDGRFLDALR
jgi:hypothetical protein